MGVTIVIGEAVPAVRGCGEVRVVAAFVEQPDAPDIAGDRAGRTNTRRPTWSAWRGFARSVGLAELLLDPLDGLTRGPSGCVRLLPGHVEEIEAALARYRAEMPDEEFGAAVQEVAGVAGRTFVLTGTLPTLSRDQAKAMLEAAGAKVASSSIGRRPSCASAAPALRGR